MTDDAINICGLKRYAVEHTQAVAAPERLPETGKKSLLSAAALVDLPLPIICSSWDIRSQLWSVWIN